KHGNLGLRAEVEARQARARGRSRSRVLCPGNVCAQLGEDRDKVLVSAVDVVDVADCALTFGGQGSEDDGRSGADVESADVRTVQWGWTENMRCLGVDFDSRSQSVQLRCIEEAILKDPLMDRAHSIGLRENGAKDRLKIGGEPW